MKFSVKQEVLHYSLGQIKLPLSEQEVYMGES